MKKTHIIALLLIVIAIGAILTTVADTTTYASFKTASEKEGREFHVVGTLNRDRELYYNPVENPNLFIFYMIDREGEERKVLYNNSKPQDFEHSEQIVVIGEMSGDEFHASGILMKCPSKYTAQEQVM
jgi:cytochrome c-type biogenesis protein CcmE